MDHLSESTPAKSEKVPDDTLTAVRLFLFVHDLRLQLYCLSTSNPFLICFQSKKETSFHKNLEPVAKTSTEKSTSRVSEEETQISGPSMKDSQKVQGFIFLCYIKSDAHCQQMPI